jgi:hypothetical protein
LNGFHFDAKLFGVGHFADYSALETRVLASMALGSPRQSIIMSGRRSGKTAAMASFMQMYGRTQRSGVTMGTSVPFEEAFQNSSFAVQYDWGPTYDHSYVKKYPGSTLRGRMDALRCEKCGIERAFLVDKAERIMTRGKYATFFVTVIFPYGDCNKVIVRNIMEA